jgi:hypothetical protein
VAWGGQQVCVAIASGAQVCTEIAVVAAHEWAGVGRAGHAFATQDWQSSRVSHSTVK